MSDVRQDDGTLTREQWAERTDAARRLSRFTYIMRRARKDVQGDPPLTDAERAAVAQIWLSGPDGGAAS
jgi:hypothetical protein